MAETFYGSDTHCIEDVGLIDVQITDPAQLIGERIARALQTPHGALASVGGNPDRGYDSRALVLAKQVPGFETTEQAKIEAEVMKDEQVESCACTLSLVAGVLTIVLSIVSSVGPFTMTMNVTELTTSLVFSFADGDQ